MHTTVSEAQSGGDDLEVRETLETRSRLERWGFPAGVRPLRESALVVGVMAVLVTFVYKLWNAHWRVPFNYSGDALGSSAYAKAIIENGWYLKNPRLGAPFTADWRDFPLGAANLHYLGEKILGLITGNYALTVNLYFIFGFFAIALSSYFVARYLRFSVPTALVIGVLYAFLPFHAFRNIAHLSRGMYFAVPLGVLVVIWLGQYRTDLLRAEGDSWRVRRGRLFFALGVAVLLGSTDDQNVMFLASILGVIALVSALRDRDWRPLALAAVIAVVGFGTLFVNNTPFLLSRVERGANAEVANRPLTDQDTYGLRPVNLILPTPGHRIGALSKIATKSARGQVTASETPGTSLGLVGSIGLLWSIGAALALALGTRKRSEETAFVAQLGVCNLVAILIGTIGGFSFLLALAGFGTYRTWNRISIFIAFFSLLVVAVGLDKLWPLLRSRAHRRAMGIGAVAVVVAVIAVGGALDQTTPRYLPDYKLLATRFDTDATFYHALEKMVPPKSMVFQLPIAAFPEQGPINGMGDYQEFAAYLHTKTLRWSYGAMKGRPEGDWQQNLNASDPASLLAQVAAVGFEGVVIDRTGFTDGARSFLAAAAPLTGAPTLTSPDNRLLYLDLTGLRARLQRELGSDAVARAGQVALGNTVRWQNFSYPEPICGGGSRRWATARTATITLDNTTNAPLDVSASTSFTANPAASSIAVQAPGDNETVALAGGTGSWQHQLTLPPGKSNLTFTLAGPKMNAPNDPRGLQFALSQYSLGAPFDSPVVAWAVQAAPACKSGP